MLKIALGQMDIMPGQPRANAQKMLAMINQAKEQNANIVIFPEMSVPGYLLGDTWEQQAFLRECEEFGSRIIAASEGIAVIFGNVAVDWEKRGNDGRPRKYNACFAAHNGAIVSPETHEYPFFIKTLQPNYREFDDARHFYSLRELAADMGKDLRHLLQPVRLNLNGQNIKIACCICEDVWDTGYTADPVAILKDNARFDLLVNIACSPFTLGKSEKRSRLFQKHAKELKTPFVYVNNVGLQNNGKTVYAFDGCSGVYGCDGRLIYCCAPFQEKLAVAELDLAGRRPVEEVRAPGGNDIAGIFRAIDYAIPKFLKTVRQNRVVIGASGGIDSAVSAALYARCVGAENLLLVNMPSQFNSATTKNLAKELADNLGCLYTVMPIDNSVGNTVSQISRTPVFSLAKEVEFNLNLTPFMTENIQARDRSARLLAGIAAAFGAVFTCNANKSELTVGYSTLYGDQAGFFAVIADLWKYQVYELANYLNQSVYGRQVIPQSSIDLVPSAELSDAQAVDKGQGDPLVYPYHDYLFRSFIEDWNRAAPEDILTWYMEGEGVLEEKIGCAKGLVNRIFKTGEEFVTDLERWWALHTGLGVAKRIQAPPVLALSRRAYGFDYRESQNGTYYTEKYLRLKARLCHTRNSGNIPG